MCSYTSLAIRLHHSTHAATAWCMDLWCTCLLAKCPATFPYAQCMHAVIRKQYACPASFNHASGIIAAICASVLAVCALPIDEHLKVECVDGGWVGSEGGGGGEGWWGFVDVCGVRVCNNINNYSHKP